MNNPQEQLPSTPHPKPQIVLSVLCSVIGGFLGAVSGIALFPIALGGIAVAIALRMRPHHPHIAAGLSGVAAIAIILGSAAATLGGGMLPPLPQFLVIVRMALPISLAIWLASGYQQ